MNISNEENFVYSLTVDQRKLYHYYKNAATEQLRREKWHQMEHDGTL